MSTPELAAGAFNFWGEYEPPIEPLRSLRALKTLNSLDLNEREHCPGGNLMTSCLFSDLIYFQRIQRFNLAPKLKRTYWLLLDRTVMFCYNSHEHTIN